MPKALDTLRITAPAEKLQRLHLDRDNLQRITQETGLEVVMEDRKSSQLHPDVTLGIHHYDPEEAFQILTQLFPEYAFCLFDPQVLQSSVQELMENFLPGDPRQALSYAVKANPTPHLLELMHHYGVKIFDCASIEEVESVRGLCPEAEIILTHPFALGREIEDAASLGVRYFTVQNRAQVDRVLRRTNHIDQEELLIAVRAQITNPAAKVKLFKKYGIPLPEASDLLCTIRNETPAQVGLAMNTGSQNTDPSSYAEGIKSLCDVAREVGGVSSLNIGGGIPVRLSEQDAFPHPGEFMENITEAIRAHVNGAFLPGHQGRVFAEIGRAMVAPSMRMAIPIRGRDHRHGRHEIHLEESLYGSLPDAIFHDWDYPFIPLDKKGLPLTNALQTDFIIYGRTCDSGDQIPRSILFPRGTQSFRIDNAGAYMREIGGPFNSFQQPFLAELKRPEPSPYELTRRENIALAHTVESTTKKQAEYIPHPLDNPKVTLVRLSATERGVIAHEDIAEGEIIAVFEGQEISAEKVSDLPNDPPERIKDHVVQIGEQRFLHAKERLAELVNHSCDPNAGIKGSTSIVARREIKAGEEITWDYSMTEDSDSYNNFSNCQCGSARCRGKLTPYRDLPNTIKQEYWPYTSDWIKAKYKERLLFPRLQSLRSESAELTEELIQEISDFFLWIFANDFAGQFLFYPSIGEPISPQDVFGTAAGEYVSLEQLKNFDPDQYPTHPVTGEKALLWIDPQKTLEIIREKLSHNAHVVILRDDLSGDILGVVYGHQCSLREAFATEEWENPHLYSQLKDRRHHRDFAHFSERLNQELRNHPDKFQQLLGPTGKLEADSPVYVWNCFALAPKARGLKKFPEMIKTFFELIPDDMKDHLIELGEPLFNSKSHQMMRTAGAIDISGVLTDHHNLSEGDPLIIAAPLSEFAEVYSLPPEEFQRRKQERNAALLA